MRCPRDGTEFIEEHHEGIDVDRCTTCKGIWLDEHQMHELESKVIEDEKTRGTLVYAKRKSELVCPWCERQLTAFNYRARNLELDMCEHGDGFWIDHGEDKQALDFLKQRIKDLERSYKAEGDWHTTKRARGSRSFLDKVKGFFTGRR